MKKKLKEEDLVNWWLEKYHNTNLERIKEKNPERAENPYEHTREFYAKYPVTEEQHDEWNTWAKSYVKKMTGYSKALIDKGWWSVYLNCSPSVIEKDE